MSKKNLIPINKIYCVVNKENKEKGSQILDRTAKKIQSYFSHLEHRTISDSEILNTVGKCLSTFDKVFNRDKLAIKSAQHKNGENDLLIILQEREKLSNIQLGLFPSFKNPGISIALLHSNFLGYLYNISFNLLIKKKEFNFFAIICNPLLVLWKLNTYINFTLGYKNKSLISGIDFKNKITANSYLINSVSIAKYSSGFKAERKHSLLYANLNDGYFPTNQSLYANTTVDSQNNLINQIIFWLPLKYGFQIGVNSNKFKLSKNFKNEFNPSYFLNYILNYFVIFEYESTFWFSPEQHYQLSVIFRTPILVVALPLLTESNSRLNFKMLKQLEIRKNYLQEMINI